MKAMHRLMVTSEAYQRSSESGPGLAASRELDPGGETLWRFRLRRLEAEPIWDGIHAAVGDLDLQVGGASFDPTSGKGGKRRGAYIVRGYSASREVTPSFLQSFDVDDGRAPCPLRTRTVTAPQALFLMNSPDVDRASRQWADRLRTESKDDLGRAVELAYRQSLARPPRPDERKEAMALLAGDASRLDRLTWLLFNLDEFLYVQ